MAKNPALSVGFLFDDTLDSSDGVAQYVKTLGAWLSSQGHQVTYLVGETKLKTWAGGPVYSMAKNQKVVFNGNRLSIPLPAKKALIKKVLAENHFDVLHVQVPYSPFMAQKVINAAGSDTAVIGSFHVAPFGKLARFGSRSLKQTYGKSLRRFDTMLSVSSAASDFAKKYYGLKSRVLPNVVDAERFAGSSKQNIDGRIVFLGRLVERKGAPKLLKAFKLLNASVPDSSLVVAGDGPQRPQLEKFVAKNGLSNKVKFLGFIDEKAKPDLLASASIACFPSTGGESFGIVLIEAMAAGAGVVLGGDNPGYRTVLGDRPQLLIDPTNTKFFAERLDSLLTNRPQFEALHGWQLAEVHNYDVKTVGPQLVDIYRQAIAKRQQSRHN